MRPVLTALLLLTLVFPATVSAATVDQIIGLSQAGVSDEVLLALIDRDKSVFPIEPEQLVALKRAGVSHAVVLAMLRSGRHASVVSSEGTEPLRMVAPDITVVGHGPEIPNASSSQNYAMFAPPLAGGALAFVGPRPCAAAGARGNTYILIGPPTVGRFVPDPAGRFEHDVLSAAQDPRSGLAGIHCHSIAASARQHAGR
jgi:hypothetical protein